MNLRCRLMFGMRSSVAALLVLSAAAFADPGDEFVYLGMGEAIPAAIAKAGPGASVAWAWTGNHTSTKFADGWCSVYNHAGGVWGNDCSAGAGTGGWLTCSVQSQYRQSVPGIQCSAKGDNSVAGLPTQTVSCSSFASATHNSPMCSVGGNSHTNNLHCSVDENGNGVGGQTMNCSAHDTTGGAVGSGGQAECSVEPDSGGAYDGCSATGNGGAGGAQGNCSAMASSNPDDKCSVVAGSGDACTSDTNGTTAFCSTVPGGQGQCSSFAPGAGGNVFGGQVQNGNLPPIAGGGSCN